MMKIIIKKNQLEFLLNNIKNEKISSLLFYFYRNGRIYNGDHITNKYMMNLNEKENDELIDELTFLMTSIGIDEKSEANSIGLAIEDIFDLLINNREES